MGRMTLFTFRLQPTFISFITSKFCRSQNMFTLFALLFFGRRTVFDFLCIPYYGRAGFSYLCYTVWRALIDYTRDIHVHRYFFHMYLAHQVPGGAL